MVFLIVCVFRQPGIKRFDPHTQSFLLVVDLPIEYLRRTGTIIFIEETEIIIHNMEQARMSTIVTIGIDQVATVHVFSRTEKLAVFWQ